MELDLGQPFKTCRDAMIRVAQHWLDTPPQGKTRRKGPEERRTLRRKALRLQLDIMGLRKVMNASNYQQLTLLGRFFKANENL